MLRNQAAKNLGSGQPNLPSEKQLMHLVQQIQLAVQSGHLNAQVRVHSHLPFLNLNIDLTLNDYPFNYYRY